MGELTPIGVYQATGQPGHLTTWRKETRNCSNCQKPFEAAIKTVDGIDNVVIQECRTCIEARLRKERHEKTYPKIRKDIRTIVLKLADRIANVEFGENPELFYMYKKEHKEFKENLQIEISTKSIDLKTEEKLKFLNEKLQEMWKYLDTIFERKRQWLEK